MKQPKTLSELYIAAKTDTGYKDMFLKEAKRLYSGFIPNAATFDQTVHIFKSKSILNENYVDLKSSNSYEGYEKEGWEVKFKNFLKEAEEESVKADTSKQSKYVDDVRKNSYDNSDVKHLDNQIGQEVLNGIYFEGKENPDKTLDELRAIVSKNLAKDPLYYVKNAMFGVKGVGVSDKIPGLKVSKTDQMTPVKMVNEISHGLANKAATKAFDTRKDGDGDPLYTNKRLNQGNKFGNYISPELKPYLDKLGIKKISNGYGDTTIYFDSPEYERNFSIWISKSKYEDIPKEYLSQLDDSKQRLLATLIKKIQAQLGTINESKASKLDQNLKNIDKAGNLATIEAKIAAVDEEITARTERLNMIDENEDLAELVNPVKLREMKKEIKVLEKEKAKFQKLYEKVSGRRKQEVITEPEEVDINDKEMDFESEDNQPLNENTDDYEDDNFEKGDKVRFGGRKDYQGQEVIWGTILKINDNYLTIKAEDGEIHYQRPNNVEKYDWSEEGEDELLKEGETYGNTPEEDKFLRKVKEENPDMLTKFISLVKNKGLEIAKEKYNEFDPEIISQNKTKASSEENDKKLLISFSKFLPKKLPELWEKTMEKTGEAEDGAFYLLLGALISKYGDRYGDDKANRIDTLITGFGLNDEEYIDKIDEFWWNLIDEKYGKHVIEW